MSPLPKLKPVIQQATARKSPRPAKEKAVRKQLVYETVEGGQLFTPAGTLRPKDQIKYGLQTFEVIAKRNRGPGMMELRLNTSVGEQTMELRRAALVPIAKLASPGARAK